MVHLLKNSLKKYIYKKFRISFSKSADDLQLHKLLLNKDNGVYVDIGCWDPIKYSNTYYFSLRNWRGICIDPNPKLKKDFLKHRPNDTFVNVAIGNEKKTMSYYMLKESSMNTLNDNFIVKNNLKNEVISVHQIPVVPLSEILEQYFNENTKIDFFDVDVEGFDLEVLKTNNWKKFRPKVILVETDLELKDEFNSELTKYLESISYKLIGKSVIVNTLGNLFFIDNLS